MTAFLMILQFFPYVLQAVTAVESTIGSETGATKKQVVLDSVTAAAGIAEGVPNAKVSAIGGLIDSVVGALNKSGIFKHNVAPAKAA